MSHSLDKRNIEKAISSNNLNKTEYISEPENFLNNTQKMNSVKQA
jgi:hypothetical protein